MKFFLFFSLLLVWACDSRFHYHISDGLSIDFYVLDQDGNDLLDPSHPNAINSDSIQVFYVFDGVPHLQYEPDFNFAKKRFEIYPIKTGKYSMELYLNDVERALFGKRPFSLSREEFKELIRKRKKGIKGIARTLVRWSPYDTDVFDAEFEISGWYNLKKVWYNGYDFEDFTKRHSYLIVDTIIIPEITQDPRKPDSLAMHGRFLVRYFGQDSVATKLNISKTSSIIRNGFLIQYYRNDSIVENIKEKGYNINDVKKFIKSELPDSLRIVNDSLLLWYNSKVFDHPTIVKCGGVCY